MGGKKKKNAQPAQWVITGMLAYDTYVTVPRNLWAQKIEEHIC